MPLSNHPNSQFLNYFRALKTQHEGQINLRNLHKVKYKC